MPLITKHHLSLLEHSFEELNKDSPYATDNHSDFSDEDGDMSDSSVLHRGRPRRAVRMPIVPIKDQVRASRTFENLTTQINELKKTAEDKTQHSEKVDAENPHELYLSSEEDGSESADESIDGYDESYVELDDELRPLSASTSTRSSFAITALAVSFVSVGKAQLISIASEAEPIISENTTTSQIPSRVSSLLRQPERLRSSSTTSYDPSARRPSTNSLPSNYQTHSKPPLTHSRTSYNPRSTLSTSMMTLSPTLSDHPPTLPPRTSSRSRNINVNTFAFPASEATEVHVASSNTNSPYTEPIARPPSSASTRTPTDRFKASMGRIGVVRKKGMNLLNAKLSPNDRTETNPTIPVQEDHHRQESVSQSSPIPSEKTRKRNRLSLHLGNPSLMNISDFSNSRSRSGTPSVVDVQKSESEERERRRRPLTPAMITDVTRSQDGVVKRYVDVMTGVARSGELTPLPKPLTPKNLVRHMTMDFVGGVVGSKNGMKLRKGLGRRLG